MVIRGAQEFRAATEIFRRKSSKRVKLLVPILLDLPPQVFFTALRGAPARSIKAAAIALSLLSFATGARAESASEPSSALARAQKYIPNFREVSPGIYAGGNPIDRPKEDELDPQGLRALADLKIGTVIDLQGGEIDGTLAGYLAGLTEPGDNKPLIERERKLAVEKYGLEWVHAPLNSRTLVNQKEADEIWGALKIMGDPSKQPVFLHCEHGSDRTGLVIALYRVYYEGWKPERALNEWKQAGHGSIAAEQVTGALDVFFFRMTGNDAEAELLDVIIYKSFVDGMLENIGPFLTGRPNRFPGFPGCYGED